MPPLLRLGPVGNRGSRRRVARLEWRRGTTVSFWLSLLICAGVGAAVVAALFGD